MHGCDEHEQMNTETSSHEMNESIYSLKLINREREREPSVRRMYCESFTVITCSYVRINLCNVNKEMHGALITLIYILAWHLIRSLIKSSIVSGCENAWISL